MRRYLLMLGALLLPLSSSAAVVEYERSLVKNEPTEVNAYFTGAEITVASSSAADLTSFGGTIFVSAPVEGDALLAGGTITMRAPVLGDMRTIAGRLTQSGNVTGDLFGVVGNANITGTIGNGWLLGGTVRVLGGATGPVTIYGSRVILSGTFADDVRVTAGHSLTVAEGTSIAGTLQYNAPQEASIAKDAVITGGITYTGKSFLPTEDEARAFAFFGAGIFFLVHLFALLIAVGLIAGLFPRFARAVSDETVFQTPSRFTLMAMLGFSIAIATPVLILLLIISFAGVAVALVIAAAYLLLMLLGYLCASIITGASLARHLLKREHLSWRHGVIGALVLYTITSIPFVGAVIIIVLGSASIGAIAMLAYRLAFRAHDEDVVE